MSSSEESATSKGGEGVGMWTAWRQDISAEGGQVRMKEHVSVCTVLQRKTVNFGEICLICSSPIWYMYIY